jgi:hypothetical protein
VDIIRLLPSTVVVFGLQYCPVHNTLYACAGIRSPAAAIVPAAAPVKGAAVAAAAPASNSDDSSVVKDSLWAIDKVYDR